MRRWAIGAGLALELDLLDTDLPLGAARWRFRVNDRVQRFADRPDFSMPIGNP